MINHGPYREFRGKRSSLQKPVAAGDIIKSNKAMFSALTEVLQKTLTSMGSMGIQLHEYSKCQMEQVNKLTRQFLR